MRRFGLALTIALSCTAPLRAQSLFPLRIDRAISVSAQAPTVTANDAASGPEQDEWLDTVDVLAAHPDLDIQVRSAAGQLSSADDATVRFYGFADASSVCELNNGDVFATSSSDFAARFAIAQPQTVDLVGTIAVETDVHAPGTTPWFADVHVAVRLNRVAGPELYSESLTINVDFGLPDPQHSQLLTAPLLFSAVLEPGIYDLTATAEAHIPQAFMTPTVDQVICEASCIVDFDAAPVAPIAPSEGDLDGDGDVDAADLARFQTAYTGPLP
jgi:hypothetical protein